MKILFIHTKYLQSSGGEDISVEAEVKLLLSKGHLVRELLFDNATMDKGAYGKIKAGIHSVYNATSARIVKKEILEFEPDVVHIHNFFFTASPAVIIAAHSAGVPVVVTIHNYRLICSNALLLRNNHICELCINHTFPWYGVLYKCYHKSSVASAMVGSMGAIHKIIHTWQKKVDRYIVPAEFIRSKLVGSSLKLPPDKVFVKRNFVEEPGSKNVKREDFFLFVGRLSEEKGVTVLLECFNELPDMKIVLAGDGPERENLASRYGHLHNVEFRGHLDKASVMQLLKSCKALLFPSICYEGLPLSIVEAFATGTPVIASRQGAMEEMIRDGVNGLLFEPGNHRQLRDLVIRFNQDPQISMYNGAYQSYLDNYHPQKCYEDVINIYQSAINEKGATIRNI